MEHGLVRVARTECNIALKKAGHHDIASGIHGIPSPSSRFVPPTLLAQRREPSVAYLTKKMPTTGRGELGLVRLACTECGYAQKRACYHAVARCVHGYSVTYIKSLAPPVFYNRIRLHSANDYLSPVDYESRYKSA
jgi:hypothetical protein